MPHWSSSCPSSSSSLSFSSSSSSSLCKHNQFLRGVIKFRIDRSGILCHVELMENAFGDEIKDVGEAPRLVGCTWEIVNKNWQVFDHHIIVGSVVANTSARLMPECDFATSTRSSSMEIGVLSCSKWTVNATNALWFGDVHASVAKFRLPLYSWKVPCEYMMTSRQCHWYYL